MVRDSRHRGLLSRRLASSKSKPYEGSVHSPPRTCAVRARVAQVVGGGHPAVVYVEVVATRVGFLRHGLDRPVPRRDAGVERRAVRAGPGATTSTPTGPRPSPPSTATTPWPARTRCSTPATPSTSPPGRPSTRASSRRPRPGASTCSARSRSPSTPPAPGPWPSAAERRRHRRPGRPRPAPIAGVRAGQGAARRTRRRGGRWPWCSATTSSSRSAGYYGSIVAGRARQGRRGHAHRALDPRPRPARPSCSAPAASVACRTANFHGLPGIEDVAVATLGFALGRHGVVDVGLARHRRAAGRCGGSSCSASGPASPRGRLARTRPLALRRRRGGVGARGRRTDRRGPPAGARVGNPDGSFLRAIAKGGPAWPSLADAVRAHELADACYASAAAGGTPIAV